MATQNPSSEKISAIVAQSAIHTYHCICTHLVLASTHPLDTLPQRALAGRDKAIILPLPPLPQSDLDSESDSEETSGGKARSRPSSSPFAMLLSTTVDRNPQIINREDGFEKRYLQRCGRCRLIIGYQLDWGQYSRTDQDGRRDDMVYLLQEGLMSTKEMTARRETE